MAIDLPKKIATPQKNGQNRDIAGASGANAESRIAISRNATPQSPYMAAVVLLAVSLSGKRNLSTRTLTGSKFERVREIDPERRSAPSSEKRIQMWAAVYLSP